MGGRFKSMRWKNNVLFWPWGRVHQRIVEGFASPTRPLLIARGLSKIEPPDRRMPAAG
jgi:hypothetical protein